MRRRKVHNRGWGKTRKRLSDEFLEVDTTRTTKRQKRAEVGQQYAQQLGLGLVDRSIADRVDKDGRVTVVGRKHLALHLVFERVGWGNHLSSSISLASQAYNVGESSLWRWVMAYDADESFFLSLRGKHAKVQWALEDHRLQEKAKQYIRKNLRPTGQQNLNGRSFAEWVNENILKDGEQISEQTARLWLHKLHFHPERWKKGVYVDGHEREDVVAYRLKWLKEKLEQDVESLTWLPTAEERLIFLSEPLSFRLFVELIHDECVFFANDDEKTQWLEEGTTMAPRPKSHGKGIMVSGYMTELDGLIDYELLEIGDGVYWHSELMVKQLRRVLAKAEKMYPYARLIFRFDNAPSHRKMPDDALNVQKMNRNPGGRQPAMRPTTWNGEVQELVFEDGEPKGIERILAERGIDTRGFTMKHSDPEKNFRQVLEMFPDFKDEKTLLERIVTEHGEGCHRAIFYPKFHAELSPIELLWSAGKGFARKNCAYNIAGLRKIVPQALAVTCIETIKRFFGKCRRYEASYRAGMSSLEAANAVRLTSHRRAPSYRAPDHLPPNWHKLCYCISCTGWATTCRLPNCTHGLNEKH